MTASSISQVSNTLVSLSLCTPSLCWRRLGHDGCCWEGWALWWEQSLCCFLLWQQSLPLFPGVRIHVWCFLKHTQTGSIITF